MIMLRQGLTWYGGMKKSERKELEEMREGDTCYISRWKGMAWGELDGMQSIGWGKGEEKGIGLMDNIAGGSTG